MQIVQGDQVPLDTDASNVRGGALKKQIFLVGDTGTPGNFKFGLFFQSGDFISPRHRHNFDQFRFQIEGECDFSQNGTMKPGSIGYFPEGAYYGRRVPAARTCAWWCNSAGQAAQAISRSDRWIRPTTR